MNYFYNEDEFESLLNKMDIDSQLVFEALDHCSTLAHLTEEEETPSTLLAKETTKNKINEIFGQEIVVSLEGLTFDDAIQASRKALRAISQMIKRILSWIANLFRKTTKEAEENIEKQTDALQQFKQAAKESDKAISTHNIPVNEKLDEEMTDFINSLDVEIMTDNEGMVQLSEYFFNDMSKRIVKTSGQDVKLGPIANRKGELDDVIPTIQSLVDQLSTLSSYGYPDAFGLYIQRLFGVQKENDIPYLRDDCVEENKKWVEDTVNRMNLRKYRKTTYTAKPLNGKVFPIYTKDAMGRIPFLVVDFAGEENKRSTRPQPFKGKIKHSRRPISDLEEMIKAQTEFLSMIKKLEEDEKKLDELMNRIFVANNAEQIAIAKNKIDDVVRPTNPELANQLTNELKVAHKATSRALRLYSKTSETIRWFSESLEYYFALMTWERD